MLFSSFISFFKPRRSNAAQAWQQAGGAAKHPYWLFAWPVHMVLGRDSFFLTEPAPVVLSESESLTLVDSLNTHFKVRGYHFYLQPPGEQNAQQPTYQQQAQWFLGLDADPKITTQPISVVKNKDVAAFLPVGEGALAWASLQNEIQMLLFAHPVNLQREQAGLLPVNSLWCDGLGASN